MPNMEKSPSPEKSERREKNPQKDEWLEIPDKILVESQGEIREDTYQKHDRTGVYTYNNSVLAVVDKKGKLHAAPATPEKEETLAKAGYEKDTSVPVPFSNGELPIMPTERKKWELMKEEAELRERLKKLERKKELLPALPEGEWIEIPEEGIEFTAPGSKDKINTNEFTHKPEEDKFKKFHTENGVIAFYDPDGNIYFAPDTYERQQALKKAGYKPGEIGVPFTMESTPTDSILKKQWELLVKQADEEAKKGISWQEAKRREETS